jgi:hypothetical protein
MRSNFGKKNEIFKHFFCFIIGNCRSVECIGIKVILKDLKIFVFDFLLIWIYGTSLK